MNLSALNTRPVNCGRSSSSPLPYPHRLSSTVTARAGNPDPLYTAVMPLAGANPRYASVVRHQGIPDPLYAVVMPLAGPVPRYASVVHQAGIPDPLYAKVYPL